ncbi:hypothetical protein A2U01_0092916, partial [Trifolium medium]|nr:hypothetical protein [Trifolium medium]
NRHRAPCSACCRQARFLCRQASFLSVARRGAGEVVANCRQLSLAEAKLTDLVSPYVVRR